MARAQLSLAVAVASTLVAGLTSIGGACLPSLRIDSVSPQPAAPGAVIDIVGAGFKDGMTLAFGGQSVDVALQSVEIGGDGEARATIPSATPPGTYELTASLDGNKATLDGVRVVPGGMNVHFIDVGQGDGTIAIAPTGEVMLLDGGPPDATPALRDAIETLAGGRIDVVVLSHTDSDHLASMVNVLAGADGTPGNNDDIIPDQRYSYFDDGDCDSALCDRARNLLAWPFTTAQPGFAIPFGDVEATIVASDGDVGDGRLAGIDADNERSVVVRLAFAGKSVLITGDLTGGGLGDEDVEAPLALKTGPIDVLRVSHHGSATSSSAAALASWQPRAVVMSLGTDNAYCHPAPEALSRLAATGARIFATGAGIVDDADRCGGEPSDFPASARVGLGTFALTIGTDGSLTLAGDAL